MTTKLTATMILTALALGGCDWGSSARAADPAPAIVEPPAPGPIAAAPAAPPDTTVPEPAREPEAAAEPEAIAPRAPAEPEPPSPTGIHLVELVTARGVEARRPVDPGEVFRRDDGMLWVFMRVRNPERVATELVVTLETEDGAERGADIHLDLPDTRGWTTFARTGTRYRAGRYAWVVRLPDGREIGRTAFELVD